MFFMDSNSSDEEEIRKLAIKRRKIRDESNPLDLFDIEFRKQFRLTKEVFTMVLEALEISEGSRCSAIPPILKLAATLSLLASGSYQRCTGANFLIGMAQPTVSLVATEIIWKIEERLCGRFISMREEQFASSKAYFFSKYKLSGIIGCIDGTHIPLIKPQENEHMFYNRKGFHSINVMIICDSNYEIIAVNPSYGGAAHDSFVWSLSEERKYLEERYFNGDTTTRLLGDSGYPLELWLLTPYRNATEGSAENKYNEIHSKARSIVERTIGILKGRWRILCNERRMRFSPQRVTSVVNASVALHNICRRYNVPFDEEDLVFDSVIQSNNSFSEENPASSLSRRAENLRNNIRNTL